MTCRKCQQQMAPILAMDAGPGGLTARNVYACDDCLVVAVENVWANEGTVWVMPDLSIESDGGAR